MKNYELSSHFLILETEYHGQTFVILYHTLTRSDCYLPKTLWEQVVNKDPALRGSEVINTLKKQGFLIPPGTDEFEIFMAWRGDLARDFSTMKSRVLVTRKCDNQCHYCTANARMVDMSSETARQMDMTYCGIIAKKQSRKVRDAYLGGEPFLNYPVLKASVERRFFFCKGREIPYEFSVTTNGRHLKRPVVRELLAFGLCRLHVSISGPADVHDRLRPSKGGGSHYYRVLRNLSDISHLVPIVIEYQYDSTKKDYLRITEMLSDFDHFGISVADIGITPILPRREDNLFSGGAGDPGIMLYLNRVLLEAGFPVYRDPPTLGCMTDLKSYLVFDADGSLLPCVALELGERAYGDVSSGIDYVAETQLLERRFPERCRTCALLPSCMGGCRLQALTAQGEDFNGIFCNYDHLKLSLEQYMHHKAEVELAKLGNTG